MPGGTAKIRLDIVDPDGSPISGGQPGQEEFTLPHVFDYEVPPDALPGTVTVDFIVSEEGCPSVLIKAKYEIV